MVYNSNTVGSCSALALYLIIVFCHFLSLQLDTRLTHLLCFCLDCILVGSLFWVLWGREDVNSINYYQAYITKLTATHINFALAMNKANTRIYRRTDPVLIIDQVPEMKDLSINARVIAVFQRSHQNWYRTGTITGFWRSRHVSIRFDNGQQRKKVPLREVRLVRRPRFCADYI